MGGQLDGADKEYGSEAIRDPKIWVEEVCPVFMVMQRYGWAIMI